MLSFRGVTFFTDKRLSGYSAIFKHFFTVQTKMNRPKVLMIHPLTPQIAFDVLKEHCELIETVDATRESILEKVEGVDAILWRTIEVLDKEILDKAGPQVKVVACMSAGMDLVDVKELKKRKIKVSNTAGTFAGPVADVAVLLALAASRRLRECRIQIETNKWTRGIQSAVGQDIAGSTVGIVGLGGIGQAVVKRLQGFEVCNFLYTGPREKSEGKKLGAKFVNLLTLVQQSDFVIVACPLSDQTRNLFTEEIFSQMKSTAVFVNVARGEIVDQTALICALKTGTIFAAGLDVMTPEPLPPQHELLNLPNVILLPHIGRASVQTRDAMGELAARNILSVLQGGELLTPALL